MPQESPENEPLERPVNARSCEWNLFARGECGQPAVARIEVVLDCGKLAYETCAECLRALRLQDGVHVDVLRAYVQPSRNAGGGSAFPEVGRRGWIDGVGAIATIVDMDIARWRAVVRFRNGRRREVDLENFKLAYTNPLQLGLHDQKRLLRGMYEVLNRNEWSADTLDDLTALFTKLRVIFDQPKTHQRRVEMPERKPRERELFMQSPTFAAFAACEHDDQLPDHGAELFLFTYGYQGGYADMDSFNLCREHFALWTPKPEDFAVQLDADGPFVESAEDAAKLRCTFGPGGPLCGEPAHHFAVIDVAGEFFAHVLCDECKRSALEEERGSGDIAVPALDDIPIRQRHVETYA